MTFSKLSNGKISTKTVAGLTTGIGKATVTATTGSPTVDTSSRAGKTIYKFTASGSITIGTAGTAEILVVGGGGSGTLTKTLRTYTSGDTWSKPSGLQHIEVLCCGGQGISKESIQSGQQRNLYCWNPLDTV